MKVKNLVERSLVISGSSGGRWVGCKNLYLGHSETTLGSLRKELGGKEKKCQKRHWCMVMSVYGHLQSTIESQDYGTTKRGILMHDTSLCCKDSPSKSVLCHTWNYFHAWHVTLLQGQPIKIWIFGGKASSAQGLNTKPNEHIGSKVIWDPRITFWSRSGRGVWFSCWSVIIDSINRQQTFLQSVYITMSRFAFWKRGKAHYE